MSYRIKRFDVGADGASAMVALGFNYSDDDSQIYLSLVETDGGNGDACTAMTPDQARELLDHLNSLLGNPLSYGAPEA